MNCHLKVFNWFALIAVVGMIWTPPSKAAGGNCVEAYSYFVSNLRTIINLETGLAYSYVAESEPETPTAHPTPDWLTLTAPPGNTPLVTAFSPAETYLVAYYSYSDFGVLFHIYGADGTLVWETSVGTIDMGFPPRYAWLDDHRLIISELTPMLNDNAVLIDLTTNESRLIHVGVEDWALSPDGRWLALVPDANVYPSEDQRVFIYDLSDAAATPLILPIPTQLFDFVWSADSDELVALDINSSLLSYNLASETWRTITSVPAGEVIQRSPCYEPTVESQLCTRVGGSQTESVRMFFKLADGTRYPVQMVSEPEADTRFSLLRRRENRKENSFALALTDTLTNRTIVIGEPVSAAVVPTLAVSPDGSLIAVAYDYPDASVMLFSTASLQFYASFNARAEETELLWSPSGRFLIVTNPGDGLDTLTLYELGTGVTTLQTGYRTWRRDAWSPDETYLVDYGAYGDFAVEMSIFTTKGVPLVENMQVNGTNNGMALYGWLDNHILIASLDPGSEALSSIDLRQTPIQPKPLAGASVEVIPCAP